MIFNKIIKQMGVRRDGRDIWNNNLWCFGAKECRQATSQRKTWKNVRITRNIFCTKGGVIIKHVFKIWKFSLKKGGLLLNRGFLLSNIRYVKFSDIQSGLGPSFHPTDKVYNMDVIFDNDLNASYFSNIQFLETKKKISVYG